MTDIYDAPGAQSAVVIAWSLWLLDVPAERFLQADHDTRMTLMQHIGIPADEVRYAVEFIARLRQVHSAMRAGAGHA